MTNGKVSLLIEDAGGDETTSIHAFNKLMRQEVVAIVGPTLSQQAFAADPLANRKKFPVLAPSNTAKGIPEMGDFITRVSAPITYVAPYALDAALKVKPNLKTVVVLYAQNDAFSTSESKTFQELVQKRGWNLNKVLKFQTTDADFTTLTSDTIQAKPDLVIISGLAADGGNLLKQLRQTGYQGVVIGGNGFNSPHLFPICQKHCDGLIVAQAYSPETTSSNPINKQFVTAFESKYKRTPGQISAQAFACVQIVAQSLAKVEKQTSLTGMSPEDLRSKLNQAILSGTFQTPLGEIKFDSQGEVLQKDFYVARVKMDSSGTLGKFEIFK